VNAHASLEGAPPRALARLEGAHPHVIEIFELMVGGLRNPHVMTMTTDAHAATRRVMRASLDRVAFLHALEAARDDGSLAEVLEYGGRDSDEAWAALAPAARARLEACATRLAWQCERVTQRGLAFPNLAPRWDARLAEWLQALAARVDGEQGADGLENPTPWQADE
jgi:hypothetical protein